MKLPGKVEIKQGELVGLGELEENIFEVRFENIEEDLASQASIYAYVGIQEASAERNYQKLKHLYDTTRAEKWKEYKRDNPPSRKKGGTTIPDLEAMVDTDPELVSLKDEVIDAEYRWKQWEAIKWSLQSKKDMIQSYVGLRRTEMEMYRAEEREKLLAKKEENNE